MSGVKTSYEVAKDVDALVILTEWNEFRSLDIARLEELMATKLILDFRNIYDANDMSDAGFRYISIGKPEIEPKTQLKNVKTA